jgi:hypothetical protein
MQLKLNAHEGVEMVNYQLEKVYKIVDVSTNECYIGSACLPTLAKRLACHVNNYRQNCGGKSSLIIISWSTITMP